MKGVASCLQLLNSPELLLLKLWCFPASSFLSLNGPGEQLLIYKLKETKEEKKKGCRSSITGKQF